MGSEIQSYCFQRWLAKPKMESMHSLIPNQCAFLSTSCCLSKGQTSGAGIEAIAMKVKRHESDMLNVENEEEIWTAPRQRKAWMITEGRMCNRTRKKSGLWACRTVCIGAGCT